jgi:hypothetical protein
MKYKYKIIIEFNSDKQYEVEYLSEDIEYKLLQGNSHIDNDYLITYDLVNREEVDEYKRQQKLNSLIEQKMKLEEEIKKLLHTDTGISKKVSCREEDCPCHT